jgi:hypothetical protein
MPILYNRVFIMSGASFITSGEADCRRSLSERASFTDFTDLSSVALPADESVAAAVSPAAVATHNCIGDVDADIEVTTAALVTSWLRGGIIMNHMTLRSCALSEIDASMPSIKPEPADSVITKANQNIGETR